MKRLTKKATATPRRQARRRDGDAEQRILDAAHAVFVRRGTAGARMQEIAVEAGVNQALLHYYFRSKDQLAQTAFARAASQFMPAVIEVMASDGELEDKVARVVALELDHLSRVPALPREALDRDARAKELDLLSAQSALRVRNIEAEHLPSVSVLAQTQYQSDVPASPFTLANGQPAFAAAKDTYDASVRVDQRIIDPAASARLAVARADLAESQARVRSTLFALKTEVNEAFFAAALLQEQLGALAATLADLEARLRETAARVREGTALSGEAAAIEATLLQQRQRADELR